MLSTHEFAHPDREIAVPPDPQLVVSIFGCLPLTRSWLHPCLSRSESSPAKKLQKRPMINMFYEVRHGTCMSSWQTCLQVAYSRVESSLELLSARVRVESRWSRCQVKCQVNDCQVNSSQVNVNAQYALELQSISGLYIQLIIIN